MDKMLKSYKGLDPMINTDCYYFKNSVSINSEF